MPEKTKPKFDPTLLIIGIAALVCAVRFPEFFKGALIFVVTLSILVFVHEWGHYQFARWAGMKVNRFALGFPPWIYTKRYKNIDYSIGALPIGGMVDIAGLGSEEEMVATAKGEGAEVAPRRPDRPFGERHFQDTKLSARFWALFAGPMMNFIYALIVFIGVLSFIGEPTKFKRTNQIEVVQAGMPAFQAGLLYGDKVIGVNDLRSTDLDLLIKKIGDWNGKPGTIVIERNGQTIKKTITPVIEPVEDYNKKNEFIGYKKGSRIGISFLIEATDYQKMSPWESVKTGVLYATRGARAILDMLGRAATGRLSSGEVREIGGPVKIGQTVNLMAKKSWIDVILGSGALSLNLGLINLLPLPALDGGRILFLGYELVARKPIDPNKESLVHVVGMVVLLAFMVFITARDIWPYLERGLRGLVS